MKPEATDNALARLDPAPSHPAGARVRLGVGAAIVIGIAALVVAVVVSVLGQQAQLSEVPPNGASAAGNGSAFGEPTGAPGAVGSSAPPPGVIIFVHVLGAVRRPGLFELGDGARVIDAVAAAGGLTETADPVGVNLARVVTDGEQLYVPARGEAQPGAPPGTPAAGSGPQPGTAALPVNLNTASVAELDSLPRIGPALAQRIVDYRDANGRFASVDDLRNVTGIGEKTFEGLKDLVRI